MTSDKVLMGLKLSKYILSAIANKARENNIKFYVVFIPSRVSVVLPYLEKRGYRLPKIAYKSVENEVYVENIVQNYLKNIGVQSISARPNLISAMDTETNIYPYREETHPLGIGYRAIAQSVFEAFYSTEIDIKR